MADVPPGERPESSSNGVEGQHESVIRAARLLDPEPNLAGTEQERADAERALADADQSSADGDQASADADQVASDRDQAASDLEFVDGVNPRLHALSRDLRVRSAREREQTAEARLTTAIQRDAGANARDLAALARDDEAARRDLAMSQHDEVHRKGYEDGHEDGLRARSAADIQRAADRRTHAAHERAEAAEHRALAAEDRRAALYDRRQSARDRLQALTDREELARLLMVAETDVLTGVRTRAAGLSDLDHEVERCRRNDGVLSVAYVDIVGLKVVNDQHGHGEGDELLKRVVALIRSHVRSYDLIVRLGGDEFLCAMSNMVLSEARERFGMVARALAASAGGGAIRTGLAELAAEESAAELIARADAEMLSTRDEAGRG
jgi:diguanylate cyclase (GGDEF)-like protein